MTLLTTKCAKHCSPSNIVALVDHLIVGELALYNEVSVCICILCFIYSLQSNPLISVLTLTVIKTPQAGTIMLANIYHNVCDDYSS